MHGVINPIKTQTTMGYLAYLVLLFWSISEVSITTGWRTEGHHGPPPSPADPPGNIFNVMKYGAIGNRKGDDSKAFLSAWEAACQSMGNAIVTVPGGRTFLVSQTQFQGPCKASTLTFQILGTILAPPKRRWANKRSGSWIAFQGVNRLRVIGNGQGSINGRGQSWWHSSNSDKNRPAAMRFSDCNNLQVSGLKHINSQRSHVAITGCNHANISGLHIIAPETSPNTDGIDISSSTHIFISNCTMETGDDCIAINGGCSNVLISEVNCGPGHGISVGSLGANGKHEEVETVSVDNCNFRSTTNGARIKTWQGGSGFARNINFTNLNFTETEIVVNIDQFYCPNHNCPNKTSAVRISDVHYKGLHGTSRGNTATISIKCSSSVPCTTIRLEDVNVSSTNPNISPTAECINTIGTIANTSNPLVHCLKRKWD